MHPTTSQPNLPILESLVRYRDTFVTLLRTSTSVICTGTITVQKTRRMIVEGLSKPDQPDVDFGPKHTQERNAVYRQRQKSALLCYVR